MVLSAISSNNNCHLGAASTQQDHMGEKKRARKDTAAESVEQPFSVEVQTCILEMITEVPPFGFHLIWLLTRLQSQLGITVEKDKLMTFLSQYYDLAEWQKRYAETALELPKQATAFELPDDDDEMQPLIASKLQERQTDDAPHS